MIVNFGVKSSTLVHETVMTLFLSSSCVVTRTTGPGSNRVKTLLSFNGRMGQSHEGSGPRRLDQVRGG